MANSDKGNIEVINGSIGDLIFRIETLTSDRDTIKVCVRAANELTAMNNHISTLTESNARLQATYDHVEEINLRYAEQIQTLEKENSEITAAHIESIEAMKASHKADIETYKAEQNFLGVAISTLTADKKELKGIAANLARHLEAINNICERGDEFIPTEVSRAIRKHCEAANVMEAL